MTNKKVLMVVASEGFRDEELFVPAEILKKAGLKVKIASDKKGKAKGDDGGEIKVDALIEEAEPDDFEAVIFIGGPGALEHLDNKFSYKLAQNFFKQNKLVAAICIAPVILAKAGLLDKKQATVWKAPLNKTGPKQLKKEGAKFKDKKVLQDGNIITASGPEAAENFGRKLIHILQANKDSENK